MLRTFSRARHRKPSREIAFYAAVACAIVALLGGLLISPPAQASTGSLSGSVFRTPIATVLDRPTRPLSPG